MLVTSWQYTCAALGPALGSSKAAYNYESKRQAVHAIFIENATQQAQKRAQAPTQVLCPVQYLAACPAAPLLRSS